MFTALFSSRKKSTFETLKQDIGRELTLEQLEGVQGGNSIDRFPSPRQPKFGPKGGSIAGGEINSNATDNNLTDSGGGIVV